MPHQSISTVVFDAVGTLIFPEPAVAAVYTAVGRRFGSKLAEAEVGRRFRDVFAAVESRDRVCGLTTSEAVENARWQEIVRRVLDDVADAESCFAELWRYFAEPSSWSVFPEVPATLVELAARGVRLAIASNFDARLVEIVRQSTAICLCQPVLVSSQVGYRKPHRQFFEAVRGALRVDPGSLLYVGDDPENDIAAARSAGFHTLLVRRHGAVGSDEAASLVNLPQLIGSLESHSKDA
jgi:putative hydrolase of the HAD superfamily